MMNEEEFGYFSKNVAERLGVSTETIRSWSLKLESEGVEFKRNAQKQRIYFEKDIRAFENLKELLDLQKPLSDSTKIIAEKFESGAFESTSLQNNVQKTAGVIEPSDMMMMIQTAVENQVSVEFKKQMLLLNPEQDKKDKFDELMITREIEKMLQEKANEQWLEQPEYIRMMRIGFLGLKKVENSAKKRDFVEEFIDEHYEEELKRRLM